MSFDPGSVIFDRCPRGIDKQALQAFHGMLLIEVTGGSGFDCLIARDKRLLKLNREFLGREYPADVLSFPSRTGGKIGEIAISADRAIDQAAQLGHAAQQEIEILMLHGALHLMGMDHERDHGKMARAEEKFREMFGLPNALIARSKKKA
ncbi:MAG: rRNA maturation RNase YbeY [Candidatus Solibacter usitatus]|nr:rRNA maturation RNase YbeY [Candidatus Solibacter usitatus]